MAEFIITRKQKDYWKMPYQVIINGRPVGTMRTPQAKLHLPAGFYTVTIRTGSYVPVGKKGKTIDMTFSTTEAVKISDTGYNCLDFKDKGRWWDIVFGIDLAVWFVALFLTIPHPWNIVYHIVSDGFFVAWLIRLFVVRKRYFAFHSYVSPTPPEEIKPRKSRLERYMEEHREEIMAREQQLYARQQERALNRQRRLYKMQQWKEKHLKRKK